MVTRKTLVLAAAGLGLAVAWPSLREGGSEVAILRTFDVQGMDLLTSLWVVQDREFVWVRANRPDRRWLHHLRQNPDVHLRRNGYSRSYRAVVFDDDDSRAYVGERFRSRYGVLDVWREVRDGDRTVPIRLVPR